MEWIVLGTKNGAVMLTSKGNQQGVLPKGSYLTIDSQSNTQSSICEFAKLDEKSCESMDISKTSNKCIPNKDLLSCIKNGAEKSSSEAIIEVDKLEYDDCMTNLEEAKKDLKRTEKVLSILELENIYNIISNKLSSEKNITKKAKLIRDLRKTKRKLDILKRTFNNR